jgi:hypothetical protein
VAAWGLADGGVGAVARGLLAVAVAACGGKSGEAVNPANAAGDGAPALPAPVVANPDGSIAFVPSLVDATRNPVICGVPDPPFADGDQFFLEVKGDAAKPPSNELVIEFTSPLNEAVGAPVAMAVQPYSPRGTKIEGPDGGFGLYADQSSDNGVLNFSYTQGTDPGELDTGEFGAVRLTMVALPRIDGDPLTIRVQVLFADGKVLDDTFSAPLRTVPAFCPEG